MSKFRKKPIVIEAEVYSRGMEDGWEYEDQLPGDSELPMGMFKVSRLTDETIGVRVYPYISTLEGRHYISEGDYIITGVNGERYPCKPDIFEKTYEAVEQPRTDIEEADL